MSQGWAPPVPLTFDATEDLTLYRFVKLGATANSVDAADTLGEAVYGVSVENVTFAEAEGASVWPLNRGGIIPIEASAAISAGANITTAADGRAVTAAIGNIIHGRAVEAASGAGHIIGFVPEYSGRAQT